jgi:Amiloride-sensitive sodium channel
LIICGNLYLLLSSINDRIIYLLSNPTADNREIVYMAEMDFPAVTICNHNTFRCVQTGSDFPGTRDHSFFALFFSL